MTDLQSDSLGGFLRSEREKRGITLEQVASATKINVRILYAIESDQYEELPAKPFVRGFVSAYSRFIGLDQQAILGQFAEYIETHCERREGRHVAPSGYAFDKREDQKGRKWLITAIFGMVLVAGGSYIYLKPYLQKRKLGHIEKLRTQAGASAVATSPTNAAATSTPAQVAPATPVVAPVVAPVIVKAPPPAPPQTPSPTISSGTQKSLEPARVPAPEDPMNKGDTLAANEIFQKIVLKSLAPVWIRYQVDGKPKHAAMLEKDKMIVFRAKDSIAVLISNPQSLEYRVSGREYRPLSSSDLLIQDGNRNWLVLPKQLKSQNFDPFKQDASLPVTQSP